MEALSREILICQTEDGREAFSEWFDTLDEKTQGIVSQRIIRLERGNLGDCSTVGGGVTELRIDFGPGYRVYFGQIGREVHLILGGQKRRQQQDIEVAKRFWNAHD